MMSTPTTVIVLAGPSCAGKTSLSGALTSALGAASVSARAVLRDLGAGGDRENLQAFGAAIEEQTSGAWLASAVASAGAAGRALIVDSARTRAQIAAVRRVHPDAVVVYLHASLAELAQRYAVRSDRADCGRSFEALLAGEIDDLGDTAEEADIYVSTDDKPRDQILVEVLDAIDGLTRAGRPH